MMKRKYNIVHILPHAGGGVGAVLRALLAADSSGESRYAHHVVSLEYLNETTQRHCDGLGISWIDEAAGKGREDLRAILDSADIVLVHWWNHPLLMRLLSEGLPASRLVIWSHVNGFYPPQAFFPELFELADRFAFSTQASMKAPAVRKLPDKLRAGLRVIRSCSGIPEGTDRSPKSGPFQAGYVGTVEPIKMHPEFLSLCASAPLPAPVIVAGGPSHEELRRKAEARGVARRFEILGPVSDPKPIFRKLHAFAYPLAPRHYGTGEQVLIEAMAFGAVPVVLANPPEEAVVRHGETGLVAKSADEFSASLRLVMEDSVLRDRLAAGGRRFVRESCGIEHSTRAFHALFEETLDLPKRPRTLSLPAMEGMPYGSPLHLFLASFGESEERLIFERALLGGRPSVLPDGFVSKTRGTSFHYLTMLGNDPALEALCNGIMANN